MCERDFDLPRLYQNVLSIDFPDSLAVIGAARTIHPATLTSDLASMAVAQLWRNPDRLPGQDDMKSWYENHCSWAIQLRNNGGYVSKLVRIETWMAWVEDAAQTKVAEHLGYGITGWMFWWSNYKLCRLMIDGLYSPHFFRLYQNDGRKAWSDARRAIINVNKMVAERTRLGTLLSSNHNVRTAKTD